jgi:hypothetical protein
MNTAAESPFAASDVQARIQQLWIYPIKSCAGMAVDEALLTPTGLEWDRAWMVVDLQGEFVTQRELPRMALIQPAFKLDQLVLRAPGMLALHLSLDGVEFQRRVRVWDDEVDAWDMGDLAAQWFSDFLGPDAPDDLKKLRLVRFDPEVKRLCSARWTGGRESVTQFADGCRGAPPSSRRRCSWRSPAACSPPRFRPTGPRRRAHFGSADVELAPAAAARRHPVVVAPRAQRADVEGRRLQRLHQRQVVELGVVRHGHHRAVASRFMAMTRSSGIWRDSVTPSMRVPALVVLLARVADRHAVVQHHRHARQVAESWPPPMISSRSRGPCTVVSVGAVEAHPSPSGPAAPARPGRWPARAGGAPRGAPRWPPAARAAASCRRQRLQHDLHRAAAGQAEALRLFGAGAVGRGLRQAQGQLAAPRGRSGRPRCSRPRPSRPPGRRRG